MARATKLTPQTHEKIVKLMRGGNYFNTACAAAGIDQSTGHKWMAWGDGRDHGLGHELPKDTTIYRAFREAIMRAEGEAIAESAMQLKLAGGSDWKAAAEYLRRRRPEDWNRGQVEVRHTGGVRISHDIAKVLEDYAAAFADDEEDGVGDEL